MVPDLTQPDEEIQPDSERQFSQDAVMSAQLALLLQQLP